MKLSKARQGMAVARLEKPMPDHMDFTKLYPRSTHKDSDSVGGRTRHTYFLKEPEVKQHQGWESLA